MTTDTPDRVAPLAGVRVLNLGTRWPGRVAAMLLADQGADVVEIVRPGRESHAVDPLLDRGKRLVTTAAPTTSRPASALSAAAPR